MSRGRAPEGTPLYVHLPFCEKKCTYCDFFSLPAEGHDIDGMVDSILHEVAARAPRRPATVFIGGGTPSLLSIAQLTRFMDTLELHTSFRGSSTETTVECNPESLTLDKAKALLDLGADRLSIGFQSLDPRTLELFGRVHDVSQSFRAYEDARRAGVRSINVDLIFAAPGQAPGEWRRDLARVLDLQPEHLSAYNLAFEEETLFSKWLEQGRVQRQSERVELELLDITLELANAAGLRRYEISNYALEGEACSHNENYWGNGSYVGVGPSAVSYVEQERFGNHKALGVYAREVRSQGHARAWEERLDPLRRLGETWWLGLRRLSGVSPRAAREAARFQDAGDPAEQRARSLVDEGLLELVSERYRLTPQGLRVADSVAAEFLS